MKSLIRSSTRNKCLKLVLTPCTGPFASQRKPNCSKLRELTMTLRDTDIHLRSKYGAHWIGYWV